MKGTPLKYQISDCPVWVLAIVLFVHGIHGDKDLAAEEPLQRQGMGEPGALESLAIENAGGAVRLALIGRDAEQQLLVTGAYASGQVHDLTHQVTYDVQPAGIVIASPTGRVIPVADGTATIRATSPDGQQAEMEVAVSRFLDDVPISFADQVVPVFTKLGCNGGGCHGKSGGQNGFQLSLFGFEPEEDYEHLVYEARGRRLTPSAPDRSLLLLKGTGTRAHGGGPRLPKDSAFYRVIRRWIEQGMPHESSGGSSVARIEVSPKNRRMNPQQHQQLVVTAHYHDDSTRNVTAMAQFESNDKDLAEVNEEGIVTIGNIPGSVAIMVRYQSQVSVFSATVPLGASLDGLPAPNNYIDEIVLDKLRRLGLPPSANADDSTFLRRVTIDVAGRIPTQQETEKFLADDAADKREEWIERLLASDDYVDYFANKWGAILRNRRRDNTPKETTFVFHSWIRRSLQKNTPYDQFVREIVTAAGEVGDNPAVTWYQEVTDASAQVEDTAQLFLGMRIQCARCHHHPYEKLSQQDYYGMAAYFSRVGRKNSLRWQNRQNIYHWPGLASAHNPKTGLSVKPTALGARPEEIPPQEDPRHRLAAWMTDWQNPFFAKALVNRYWKHFFGRGLVDPEDDMRATNPPSNPQLLEALSEHFKASGYDLKELVRTICTSKIYQLSAEPNAYNQIDKQNFSRFYPRRLNAEVLLDSIDELTETPTRFVGMPLGTRAVQLPDNAFSSYFLTVFGRPDSASACECERSIDATLAQSLHLLNSKDILNKVGGRRTQQLATDARTHDQGVRDLYLIAFCREPTMEETKVAVDYLQSKNDDLQGAYEDLVWVLVNTKEFLFNH